MVIEVPFSEVAEDEDPEPLTMDYFYFPLGLLIGGLVLSTVAFLVEIVINRCQDREDQNEDQEDCPENCHEEEDLEEEDLYEQEDGECVP